MRIWLTRGYSLGPIGAAMRSGAPGHEVLASASASADAATAAVVEPDPVEGPDYLDFLCRTVAERGIDVLVPTRRAALVERHRARVETAGCRVEVAAPADALDLVHDKLAFARALDGDPLVAATFPVRSADELRSGLAELAARGLPACVKPARGVNGLGFLAFTDRPRLAQLAEPELRETRPDTFAAALREAEVDGLCPPHALMEYLPGEEVSIDALAWRGRLLAHAARTKRSATEQHLSTDHPLASHVGALVGRFALHGLVSVQFRHDVAGAPKLLEINPRPAGGSTFAEAAGCGLIRDWTRLLVGEIGPEDVRPRRVETTLLRREIVEPVRGAADAGRTACAA